MLKRAFQNLGRCFVFGIAVCSCIVTTSGQVSASCGDYLHKRGQNQADMEPHREAPECEGQRQGSIPIAPPTTTTHGPADEMIARSANQDGHDATRRIRRRRQPAVAMAGHMPRIDRPPRF